VHLKVSCIFVIDLVKQENSRKVEDNWVEPDSTVLIPDVVSAERKEDSISIDKESKLTVHSSPLKQTKFESEVMKTRDIGEIKKNQPLRYLSTNKVYETKSLHELSQPRIKRRRVLSKDIYHTAKESDKFPFSPIYKRTRSFHKKTLPVSSLTVHHKDSQQGSVTQHNNIV